MKSYQPIFMFVGLLFLVFLVSHSFSEVMVKIGWPENGDIFEPCQDITLVADIQTTEPDTVEKIRFYNNDKLIKFDTYFPWEYTMKKKIRSLQSDNGSLSHRWKENYLRSSQVFRYRRQYCFRSMPL